MGNELRVGCVQMVGVADRDLNLERAESLVRDAAAQGAEVVILPEHWNVMGDHDHLRGTAEPLEGESVAAVRRWAAGLGVAIVGGSIVELTGDGLLFNTCVAADRDGEVAAVYRKIHLFDVHVGGVDYEESALIHPGRAPCSARLGGWAVGLTICYDLRFPELYRALALESADLITVPANFTLHTGRDHWEVLLRARAIENQVYVAAAAQYGEQRPGRPSYGRSLICNPWGTVLAQAGDGEAVVVARLSREYLRDVRARLPALAHRMPEAYGRTRPACLPPADEGTA